MTTGPEIPESEAEATARLLDAVRAGEATTVTEILAVRPGLATSRDGNGVSIVLLATYHGHHDVQQALLEHHPGPDVFEAAATGDVARLRELVEEDGERARADGADGFSPLGLAAFFGHAEAVDLLLARGADPRRPSRNVQRIPPLSSACAVRDAGIAGALARRLLDAGADPDATQAGGFTPLHQAAAGGKRELAELLLAHGADRGARTDDGRLAADLARERGHDELATWLDAG